jgi:predicted transcriptional regulator
MENEMSAQAVVMTQAAPTTERIMQVGSGFLASKTLLSAVEMGVFTELADGPQEFYQLASRLGLHPRSARDFLDTLVSMGFLERKSGRYRNGADADLYLDKGKASYIGGALEMANARLYRYWGNLTEALRTGQQQNEAKDDGGASPFTALYAEPERLKGFLSAMSGLSRASNVAIAEKIPWDRCDTFADIGTAQGDLAVQIALKNPHLRGIGFDLAEVRPVFDDYTEANGVCDRVRFQAGDFFRDELPRVDVITMGHILHDWNLEEKKLLIRKAYEALPLGGMLVVYDAIIDDERRENTFGLLMSLNMLIETPGGFDYTGRECMEWMEEAGFSKAYVAHLVGPDSMVVGVKG